MNIRILDDLERLDAEASPRPWVKSTDRPDDIVITAPRAENDDRPDSDFDNELVANVDSSRKGFVGVAFDINEANGQLIEKVRNALPQLLQLARLVQRIEARRSAGGPGSGSWDAELDNARKLLFELRRK